ncbi:MAG: hypothetical protein ABFE01_00785 [Phycisphaerales bacterium]|jgi:hypothetical protein
MARWKIKLRNAARDRNAGTILVDAENLVQAKRHAMRVCRRHLAASNDIYLETRGRNTYGIVLGGDEVGEATITRLKPRRRAVREAQDAEEPLAV